jgi:hypothetical protein
MVALQLTVCIYQPVVGIPWQPGRVVSIIAVIEAIGELRKGAGCPEKQEQDYCRFAHCAAGFGLSFFLPRWF